MYVYIYVCAFMAGISEVLPVFIWFVGHLIFKRLIWMHYPVSADELMPGLILQDTEITLALLQGW